MSNKRSSYAILKEKIAKLEKECDEHREKNSALKFKVEHDLPTWKETASIINKERDEYKAKYLKADAERQDAIDRYNRERTDYADMCRAHNILSERDRSQHERICWLLKHASWFTLWKYKRLFEEGGKP